MREASGEKKIWSSTEKREKYEEFGGGGSRSNIANDVCSFGSNSNNVAESKWVGEFSLNFNQQKCILSILIQLLCHCNIYSQCSITVLHLFSMQQQSLYHISIY